MIDLGLWIIFITYNEKDIILGTDIIGERYIKQKKTLESRPFYYILNPHEILDKFF